MASGETDPHELQKSRGQQDEGPEPCNAILVVEDDDLIRETEQFALEVAGYKVFGVANGKEAIELLSAIPPPCMILLDLMMPVMNGWEFVEAIEQDKTWASIPIVVVTAFADKAKSIRARNVISKPASLATVLALIKECCADPTGAPA